MQPLPIYTAEELAKHDISVLVGLMIADEDRVPRNVIDECARRGETMLDRLTDLVDDDAVWGDDVEPGEWWLLLHAVMILGLMEGERAGLLLVKTLRRMDQQDGEDLQEWCSGHWPALFRNKPEAVLQAVRAVCEDRELDWFIRTDAVDAFVAAATGGGATALDQTLDWLASMAGDETEDPELRDLIGMKLLDYPRLRFRPLLEEMAKDEREFAPVFSIEEIEQAYADPATGYRPVRSDEPWAFYTPESIQKRQERWEDEDAQADAAMLDDTRFLQPVRTAPKVGRNDPCPCGSGKKYKKCCLLAETAAVETPEEFLRRRIRAVKSNLTEDLLRFVNNQFKPGLMQEAWEDFTGGSELWDDESPHMAVFMPWFLHAWYPTRGNTGFPELAARKATIASEWVCLKRRHLDALLVRYIEAWAAATYSFHEVVRVEPGRGFLLRDLMLETETFAIEHSASRTVGAGDSIFAQIVRVDGLAMIEGCGSFAFAPREKPEILQLRKEIRGRAEVVSVARLRERSLELIDVYLELTNRKLNPVMPTLANTDDELLELHSLIFGVTDAALVAAKLDAAQLADGETIVKDRAEPGTDGSPVEGQWSWLRAGNTRHKSWENTTLGQISLARDQLKVTVNSAARADRARAMVEGLLEANAKYRVTEITSAESMLKDVKSRPAPKGESEHERLMKNPEVRKKVEEVYMRHYMEWLDTRIPLLQDRTPRVAVGERDGREAVAALIMQIERDGARQSPPLDPQIPAMLRRELGLG